MRFGIFFELSVPRPFTGGIERRVVENSLEQARLADEPGFGVDPATSEQTWDEYVRALPRLWMEDDTAWDGVCFSMPERAVLPKPVQKPHPPLWVTATSLGTELDAAERGIGYLGVASTGHAEQERRARGSPWSAASASKGSASC